MKTIEWDRDKVFEYLQFLVDFAEELRGKDLVLQQDLERINREMDKFISRLDRQGVYNDLAFFLRDNRIRIHETDISRPTNLLYMITFFIFFGWVGAIYTAQQRNIQDSRLRKEQLDEFRLKIINISRMVDDLDKNDENLYFNEKELITNG